MKNSWIIFGFTLCLTLPAFAGFKGPSTVLDTALKAIRNLDEETFIEASGKEALCVFGTKDGVAYLNSNFHIDSSNLKTKITSSSSKYFLIPEYVGYWTYYRERYAIDLADRRTGEVNSQFVIDCDYGIDGDKDLNLRNLRRDKYHTKDCKVVKIIPKTFAALPAPDKCQIMLVDEVKLSK